MQYLVQPMFITLIMVNLNPSCFFLPLFHFSINMSIKCTKLTIPLSIDRAFRLFLAIQYLPVRGDKSDSCS